MRAFLAALSLWALLALPASAQEGTSDARDREARSLFEAGRTAFEDGRYGDARDYFQRAYELSGRADMLYNIANAEDRMRHDREALAAFEGYLAGSPAAPNRVEVEARMESLRAAIAEREALEAASREPEPAPPPPAAPGPTLVWTWIAGGAALAFGAVAVGTWVGANDAYGGLERGCYAMRGGCTADEISGSGVEALVLTTNVFFVGSLVLAGATGVALAVELTSGGGGEPSASVRLGPGSLSLEGTF
jgi:hypothetical protein